MRVYQERGLHERGVQFLKQPVLGKLMKTLGSVVSKSVWLTDYSEFLLTEFDPSLSILRNPARVMAIHDETHDARTFVLKPLRDFSGFVAGQHVAIEIEVNGARLRRNYTISSSPARYELEGVFTITVKRQPEGKVSNALHDQVLVGGLLHLGKVTGSFLLNDPGRKTVMFAAGSGITPFISMAEDILASATNTILDADTALDIVTEQWLLMYYARTENDFILGERLTELSELIPGFQCVQLASDSAGNIKQGHIKKYCKDISERQVMLCGPGPFMDAARVLAEKNGVEPSLIFQESFGMPTAKNIGSLQDSNAIKNGSVTFSRSGKTVASDGKRSILEIAESLGLNPKFGCRAGVCHECKCKKTAGSVLNLVSGKVEDADEGMVQTCIAVPHGNIEVDL